MTKTRLHILRKIAVLSFVLLALSGCIKNGQLRTEYVEGNCLWDNLNCNQSMVEQYPEYDLAFIEFSERGNLYSREDTRKVFDFIDRKANQEDGAAVFVFVHGWKNNAEFDNKNVRQFRDFLSRAAENAVVGERKVIGLFLGWRGDVTNVPIARNLTYWGRKSVAEEIGSGGVTEVFAKLNQILIEQYEEESTNSALYKNTYVIIGHSFGGAIVLSALHDVLLDQLVDANPLIYNESGQCHKIKRFADALVLLNPAIEANRAILLKEAAARCNFKEDQPRLMHVLSSDGDNATRIFFPIGQYVNLALPSSPKKLERAINGKKIIIDERKMDLNTIGNLKQLRTGYLSFDKKAQSWAIADCMDDLGECGITGKKQQRNHFPINKNDPLSFIKTDRNFIKNHGDVFGCYVQSYITAIIFETQAIDKGYRSDTSNVLQKEKSETIDGCNHIDFDFKQCFNNQLEDYDCDVPTSSILPKF